MEFWVTSVIVSSPRRGRSLVSADGEERKPLRLYSVHTAGDRDWGEGSWGPVLGGQRGRPGHARDKRASRKGSKCARPVMKEKDGVKVRIWVDLTKKWVTKLQGLECGAQKHEIPTVATRGQRVLGVAGSAVLGPHSPVFASTETGPWRFPPWSPKRRNLYLRAGSKPEMVTSLRSLLTGTVWGCPWASLYWTRKESKGPWATVQDRRTVLEVTSATARTPRRGSRGGSVGRGAATEQRRLRGTGRTR